MRFLVWICRVIMAVVVAAFVATVFSMTHDVDMDGVQFALGLITVIGAGVVAVAWPLMHRYWQSLILLLSLGLFRGLFGSPGLTSLEADLVTELQATFLWVTVGVGVVALAATLVWRAIANERALNAMKQAVSASIAGKAPAVETPPTPAAVEATPVAAKEAAAEEVSADK